MLNLKCLYLISELHLPNTLDFITNYAGSLGNIGMPNTVQNANLR